MILRSRKDDHLGGRKCILTRYFLDACLRVVHLFITPSKVIDMVKPHIEKGMDSGIS